MKFNINSLEEKFTKINDISNNIKVKGHPLKTFDTGFSRRFFDSPKEILNKEDRFTMFHNQTNQMIMMLGNQTCSRKSTGGR